ncbi:MAG TPA: glycogen debranching N-terminal domain-containing protein [Leptolyngbya sp.]|jgi:glycogen debranching enzyme|nr:glycogen debranching N-terminal domain-containing protein [Leptolyngbya sp.]
MPTKVFVNSGQITINDGAIFLVTSSEGLIDETLAQGFFVQDTRLISYYEVSLNRDRLLLLASSSINHHSALYQFTNSAIKTAAGILPANSLMVSIRRDVGEGMHEDIDIVNRHHARVQFQLMLAIRSDFADIFEVKAQSIVSRGESETVWKDHKLTTNYHNGSFCRSLTIEPTHSSSEPRYANGRLIFDVALDPGQAWHTCINFIAVAGETVFLPDRTCVVPHQTEAKKVSSDFLACATTLVASNRAIAEYYQQALTDLSALQISFKDSDQDLWMPAAGIPWFMAVFGRDAVTVSLQTVAVSHEFAHGTLVKLAQLQATTIDDWRDAQPGKMPHELRQDELTALNQLPYTPYYGTNDTTILWIIALAEAYRWSANITLLDRCREPLEKALAWIDQFGDFDKDGFVEYLTHSSDGLKNQGWKDSGDAIVHADGSQAEPPIALCEVQGYVYDAWNRAAELYEIWNEPEKAKKLRHKANDLYQRFNDRYWMEEEGFYCLGLDCHKQQIRAIASNPGQLLASGIVPRERAELLVKRLFQPDLWCGWGIRTLSSQNPAYNPISYQLGSVWPHDNSFIAAGLKRYGFHDRVNQIAEGIFAAASYFEAGRMPELFGGMERQSNNFPVPYTDANIPQAWAAGSICFLIRSMLGLSANAPKQELSFKPVLPDWLPDLELRNLQIGSAIVSLKFWRNGDQTEWEVLDLQGNLSIVVSSS